MPELYSADESLPYCRMIIIILIIVDRYHPDKNASNPEASELFKEVAYSYSILSDPEKRRQYDTAGFEVLFYLCLVESTILYYNFVFPSMLLHFLTFSDLSDQNC